MPKLSVIIPVYNVEKFLRESLNSVLSQTFSDIEIICVNDGSTDESASILEEYQKRDSRIVIINKENEGPLCARKAGLKVAKGEYIGFVDSDDWIEPNMYEELYSKAKKYDVDLVTCGYKLEGAYTTLHFDNIESGYYSESSIQYLRDNTIYNFEKKETGLRGSLWSKLFRKDILEIVQSDIPDIIKLGTDKLTIIHYILHCSSVYVIDKPLYHWRINNASITHRKSNNYLHQVSYIYEYLTSLYNHDGFSDSMKNQVEMYLLESVTVAVNTRLGLKNSNLLRVDPCWMDDLELDSHILFVGGGELGDQYKRQLSNMRKDVSIVKDCGFDIPTKDDFEGCDAAVIGIKNKGRAMEVKASMIEVGIPEDKILWTPQPEFFWKYVEAEGLLD